MTRISCTNPVGPSFLGLSAAILLVIGAAFWSVPAPAGNDRPLKITVSIPPQAWFVERIGGDRVQVQVLLSPGHSPATYEPTFKQMAELHECDLFLAAGVPFELGLLPRLEALPGGPRIAGIRPVPGKHRHDHSHLDPHFWLDPARALTLADSISAVLTVLDAGSATRFQEGLDSLQLELGELSENISEMLAPYEGRDFFVFHPAFGHFARAFGLEQVAIEDDGHEPGARRLAEVIDRAKAAGARAVIVQPQFSHRSAEAVAEAIGAKVVALDPLAEDYKTNLLHIASTLAEVLSEPRSGS